FFFQAEDGIRDRNVTGFRRVLFRSDYDLTFELVSAANWPVTRWNSASTGKDQDSILRSIHLEFDYRETTNRLPAGQGAWWRLLRSEERRVGKECRSRWVWGLWRKRA